MRIGIVTFHNAINYGAIIQCFALKKFLENSGNNVEIVNFRCKSIEKSYPKKLLPLIKKRDVLIPLYWPNAIKKCREAILTKKEWINRHSKFEKFLEESLKVSQTNDYEEQLKRCDVIVYGSDQIWNKSLTGKDASFYFGEIETRAKKTSYAASCYYVDQLEDEDVRKIMKNFDSISVRERSLATYIRKSCTNIKDVFAVMDPVFLLDAADYISLIPERIKKEKYCFSYFVNENREMRAYIDYLRRDGLKVIELHYFKDRLKGDEDKIYNLGPVEFLNYLFYSDMVITDSFHGTALSIIFKKNFWAFGNSMRIYDLLSEIGLSNRIISNKENLQNYNSIIDYTNPERVLFDAVKKSKEFLNNAIRTIEL